jgi:hypothetical protein
LQDAGLGQREHGWNSFLAIFFVPFFIVFLPYIAMIDSYHFTLCDQYFADSLLVGLPCALCLA